MTKLAITGCGHWGKNYVRNFAQLDGCELRALCDLDEAALERAHSQAPGARLTTSFDKLLESDDIDAVVIATTAATHFPLVTKALERGWDVLAEKPLTLLSDESAKLVKLAQDKGRILMVGHTFLYNSAVRKIKQLIDDGMVGDIYYLKATRTHLGLIREDVNAAWDLAPHDVSIFNYWLDAQPVSVTANGSCFLKDGREDVAFINLTYPKNISAAIHVSWVDSNKVRKVEVVGSKGRVVFDDLDNLEPVRFFEKGISVEHDYDNFGEFRYALRDGDIISPKIEFSEPLKDLCRHFIECVEQRTKPLTCGRNGFEVVKVMEEIEKQLNAKRK